MTSTRLTCKSTSPSLILSLAMAEPPSFSECTSSFPDSSCSRNTMPTPGICVRKTLGFSRGGYGGRHGGRHVQATHACKQDLQAPHEGAHAKACTSTHARTHARTHAHTHTHAHACTLLAHSHYDLPCPRACEQPAPVFAQGGNRGFLISQNSTPARRASRRTVRSERGAADHGDLISSRGVARAT